MYYNVYYVWYHVTTADIHENYNYNPHQVVAQGSMLSG